MAGHDHARSTTLTLTRRLLRGLAPGCCMKHMREQAELRSEERRPSSGTLRRMSASAQDSKVAEYKSRDHLVGSAPRAHPLRHAGRRAETGLCLDRHRGQGRRHPLRLGWTGRGLLRCWARFPSEYSPLAAIALGICWPPARSAWGGGRMGAISFGIHALASMSATAWETAQGGFFALSSYVATGKHVAMAPHANDAIAWLTVYNPEPWSRLAGLLRGCDHSHSRPHFHLRQGGETPLSRRAQAR